VKARDLVATLPGRLRAVAVEPLEMPAPSETPGPVPEDEHRPNRTERGGRSQRTPARAVNGAHVREAGHPAPIEPDQLAVESSDGRSMVDTWLLLKACHQFPPGAMTRP
jgi:hypothetical protein